MASGDMEDYSLEGKFCRLACSPRCAFLNRGSDSRNGRNHGEGKGFEAVGADDSVPL